HYDPRDLHSFPTRRSSDLGVALVDQPHMLRPVIEHRLHVGYRLRRHVGEHAAVGTFEAEGLSIRVVYAFVALDDYAHRCPFFSLDRKSTRLNSSHVKISYA